MNEKDAFFEGQLTAMQWTLLAIMRLLLRAKKFARPHGGEWLCTMSDIDRATIVPSFPMSS